MITNSRGRVQRESKAENKDALCARFRARFAAGFLPPE